MTKRSKNTGPNVLRRELPNQMRTRFFRPIGTMLSLLLLIAVPAQASPIKFADVVNVIGDLQNGGQFQRLRLRAVAQEPTASGTSGTASTPPIPEPASLFLFGSGILALSAGTRRRYAKMRASKQAAATTEV